MANPGFLFVIFIIFLLLISFFHTGKTKQKKLIFSQNFNTFILIFKFSWKMNSIEWQGPIICSLGLARNGTFLSSSFQVSFHSWIYILTKIFEIYTPLILNSFYCIYDKTLFEIELSCNFYHLRFISIFIFPFFLIFLLQV